MFPPVSWSSAAVRRLAQPEPKPTRCEGRVGFVDPDVAHTTIAAPAVGDLDADDDLEIVVATYDGGVFAVHHDGTNVDGFPVEIDRHRIAVTETGRPLVRRVCAAFDSYLVESEGRHSSAI